VRLYRLLDELVATGADDGRLGEAADLIVELAQESADRGDLDRQGVDMGDDAFIGLVDSYASDAHPVVERLQELLEQRGWTGWARMEPTETTRG
jgi:hypothetical protein